jgi:thiol-disulfide isomerase/thioredoxin
MLYLNTPVHYLQRQDLSSSGDIINTDIPTDKPVVVMVQSSWCGYCTQSKPAFQEFAEKNKNRVFATTIQSDGDMPGEKEAGEIISATDPTFQGFPHYMLYINGKKVDKTIKGRDVKSLEEFCYN